MKLADIDPEFFHFLLLDDEVLPVEHLDLSLVFCLLEQNR